MEILPTTVIDKPSLNVLKFATGKMLDGELGVGVTVGVGVVISVLSSVVSDSPAHAVRRVNAANALTVLKDITFAILIYDLVILTSDVYCFERLFTVTVCGQV